MECFRNQAPLLVQAIILFLGLPVAAAEIDCDCKSTCTQWIILAATVPPFIIATVAGIVLLVRHLKRRGASVANTDKLQDEENTEEPVYDSYKDSVDSPVGNSNSPPKLPERERAKSIVSTETVVTSMVEVVSETPRGDVEQSHDEKAGRRRKKSKKMTDLGKQTNTAKTRTKRSTTNSLSNSHSMRNTLGQTKNKTGKAMSLTLTDVEDFSNLASVTGNDNSDDIQDSEIETQLNKITSTSVREEMREENGRWKDAISYLDDAISINAEQNVANEESDMDASELQALYEKAKTDRLSRNSSFHSVDFFEISRPNSPVPDIEAVAIINDPTLRRPLSHRNTNSSPLIDGIQPHIQLEQARNSPTVLSSKPNTPDPQPNTSTFNPFSVEQKTFKRFEDSMPTQKLDKSVNKHISSTTIGEIPATPQTRAQTPDPFGNSSGSIKEKLPHRSKTPNPSVSKKSKQKIVQIVDKDIPSTFSTPAKTSEATDTNTIETLFNQSKEKTEVRQKDKTPKRFVGMQDHLDELKVNKLLTSKTAGYHRSVTPNPFITQHTRSEATGASVLQNDSHLYETKRLVDANSKDNPGMKQTSITSQRSLTPNPFIVQHTKSLPISSKTPEPYVSRGGRHHNFKTQEFGTKFTNKKTTDNEQTISKETFQEEKDQSIFKRNNSNIEDEPDKRYLSPRSQTPDQFGSPRKDTRENNRTRSQTPDPLGSTPSRITPSGAAGTEQPAKRLDKMLNDSKSQRTIKFEQPETTHENEVKFRHTIANIPVRAKTPDPLSITSQGLVYNKHFAANVHRSKSVNDRGNGKQKLHNTRGESTNIMSLSSDIGNPKSNNSVESRNLESVQRSGLSVKPNAQKPNTGNLFDNVDKNENKTNKLDIETNSTATGVIYDKLMNIAAHHVEKAELVSNDILKQSNGLSKVLEDISENSSDGQRRTGMAKTAAKLRSRRLGIEVDDDDVADITFLKNEPVDTAKQKDLYDRLLQDMKGNGNVKSRERHADDSGTKQSTGRVQFRTSSCNSGTLNTNMINSRRAQTGFLHESSKAGNRSQSLDEKGVTEFYTHSLGQSDRQVSKKWTATENGDTKIPFSDSRINRSKSLSERQTLSIDENELSIYDDENHRKRKHSSLKIPLPDMNALPRKSILKTSTSPSSAEKKSFAIFPLSQLVSSANPEEKARTTRFSRSNSSVSNSSRKGHSIIFEETTTFIGSKRSEDNAINRSLSYSERNNQTPTRVSQRPPTPAPQMGKKKRLLDRGNWKMTSTKF